MAHANSGAIPNLRRNGKPPSCEPCRVSKLSCDHVMPVCGRCQRRKISDKCSYHPAPMTGLKTKRQTSNDPSSTTPELHRVPKPSTPAPLKRRRQERSNVEIDHSRPLQAGVLPAPGFLGSTSYSAVFTENRDQIDLDPDQEDRPATSRHSSITVCTHDQRQLREGCGVIDILRHFHSLRAIAQRWAKDACDYSLIVPHFLACVESIERDIYLPFVANRSESSLIKASEKLFAAFSRHIKIVPGCKFEEFPEEFTGKNIRWETLGVFFTAVGLGIMQIPATDPLLDFVGRQADAKRGLCRRILDASNSCITFSDEAGHLSDLSIALLIDNCVLMSQVLGDANYLTWRRLGDLSTAVFALGLHQEIRPSRDTPFWLVELRRRAFAASYGLDKNVCAFVGRPPRLSKRYCAIEAPLDLEWKDLELEGSQLQAKLDTLDQKGWAHPTGERTRSSFHLRALLLISEIREEILELSLGTQQENTYEIAADIARRNKEVWESFPNDIKYYPEIWASDKSREDCVQLTVMYLDVIYNDFMLQRMLVRRIRARSDEVIRISRLLMNTLIEMLSNHGRSSSLTCDDPWMIVLYGLPAAGVLALELLQQRQPSSSYPSHRSNSPANQNTPFPRSEIIQNLSVLVSYLGWVHVEGDGNYDLCMQARRMLQRILDKVLSPQTPLAAPPPAPLSAPAIPSQQSQAQQLSLPASPYQSQTRQEPITFYPNHDPSYTSPMNYPQHLPTPPTSIGSTSYLATDQNATTNNHSNVFDFSWMDSWNAEFEADFWMNLPDHPLLAAI